MFYRFSDPGDEESNWSRDEYDLEPNIFESARDLGYNIEGVKRYSLGPSPREPVEKHITNYAVFDEGLEEKTGRFSGIRAEYTPFKLRVERVPEDDIITFLNPGTVAMGGLEAEEANDRASMIASIYKRKNYDPEMAQEVIEMADTKMDLGVPEPDITDFENEEVDIFNYSYPLEE